MWTHYGDESCAGQCDVARGNIGDIDPNYDGFEVWSFQGTYNAKTNTMVAPNYLYPVIRYWWDGDEASESYNDGKIEKWDYNNKAVNRVATTWNIYGSSGSERGAGMFHGDIIGDWREESILVNYTTNELVIFTTDFASDIRFYSLAQNPCYRNGMTTKGYVQASMLDYYLGYGMDKPSKPNIEIIGGSQEPEFNSITPSSSSFSSSSSSSSTTFSSSSSSQQEVSSSSIDEDPQSILTHQNYIPQWNLSENYGTVIFQTGDFSAVVRLFDMNGKLLTERFVNRSENWSLPLFNGILLMQVNENNHFSTRKIISPL